MTAIRNIQSRIYIRRNWIKYSSSPLPHIRMPKVWWFLTMIITLTRQDLFDAFPDEAGQIHNDSLLQKGRETICLVGAQKYKFQKKKIILVRRRKRLHHVLPLLTLHTKDPYCLDFSLSHVSFLTILYTEFLLQMLLRPEQIFTQHQVIFWELFGLALQSTCWT